MPERAGHAAAVRPGTPLAVGALTLLPVERVVRYSDRADARLWFLAEKQPYALIVRDASGVRAFGADGAAVSLQILLDEVPELGTVLAAL